jgi:hypothetical protein
MNFQSVCGKRFGKLADVVDPEPTFLRLKTVGDRVEKVCAPAPVVAVDGSEQEEVCEKLTCKYIPGRMRRKLRTDPKDGEVGLVKNGKVGMRFDCLVFWRVGFGRKGFSSVKSMLHSH